MTLKVGLIGIAPDRGWAQVAHVPALRALPDYEIVAVATRRMESAEAAAAHFGIPLAFDDARALAAHPDVDVVSICVSVPGHYQAICAAIDAGKNIFCEGPVLCANLNDATEVARRVREKRVRTIVGCQSRTYPTFSYAKDLIADGYVGDVLSCMMTTTWRIWGAETPKGNAYAFDRNNSASALMIAGGHGIDIIQYLLGPITKLSGATRVQRHRTKVLESGEFIPATAVQQFAMHGELLNGALASVHIQGGAYWGSGLRLEINGTDGDILISSDQPFGVTSPDVKIRGLRRPEKGFSDLEIPGKYTRAPASLANGRASGTAQLYMDLAAAISAGTEASPNFDDALEALRVLDAVERSATSGTLETLSG